MKHKAVLAVAAAVLSGCSYQSTTPPPTTHPTTVQGNPPVARGGHGICWWEIVDPLEFAKIPAEDVRLCGASIGRLGPFVRVPPKRKSAP